MGINDEYGCFVDEENGAECVMDRGCEDGIAWSHEDCIMAQNLHAEGKSKAHCKYWRSKTGDHWNDGLEFAINIVEAMVDDLQGSGQIQKSAGLVELADVLEVYLD